MAVALQSSLRVPQAQATQVTVLPAPRGGIDARISMAADDPNVCLAAVNILPVEYGMRVRKGYRIWQQGLPSEVRTVVPYEGLDPNHFADRIFAVCAEGIYDVTALNGSPVQKLAFTDNGDDAGWGVYTHYIDESGDALVYYADGANGLFVYNPGSDTWAQASGIIPAATAIGSFAIEDIVFIVAHKLRLWFICKGQNKAWYLGVRASTGEAKEFFFGAKFKHGGDLVGLFNWTVDGGAGRDDHLVAVSRGGDVLPYTGDDPSSDLTWENTGVFFIGRVPRGNRVASEYGGELYLLSSLGVISMRELMTGAEMQDPSRSLIGAKVALPMRADMQNLRDRHGWNIKFVADEGLLVVNTPERIEGGYRQYVMNTTTSGWGFWRDVPYVCGEAYDGDLMIGAPDGRVLRMDVTADEVSDSDPLGRDIRWWVLTSFQTLGQPGLMKRAKFIRPNFMVSGSPPAFDVRAVYDFLIEEPTLPAGGVVAVAGSLWDSGLWDQAEWSDENLLPSFAPRGANGIGRTLAVNMVGRSRQRVLLASWDVAWCTGGML